MGGESVRHAVTRHHSVFDQLPFPAAGKGTTVDQFRGWKKYPRVMEGALGAVACTDSVNGRVAYRTVFGAQGVLHVADAPAEDEMA